MYIITKLFKENECNVEFNCILVILTFSDEIMSYTEWLGKNCFKGYPFDPTEYHNQQLSVHPLSRIPPFSI